MDNMDQNQQTNMEQNPNMGQPMNQGQGQYQGQAPGQGQNPFQGQQGQAFGQQNSFDINKIIRVFTGWFTSRPMNNFNLSLSGLENACLFILSILSITIFINSKFSFIAAFANAYDPSSNVGTGVAFLVFSLCAIYMGMSLLSLTLVSRIYGMRKKARNSVFQTVAISSSLLTMFSLAALIIGALLPKISLLVYAVGINAFWAAIYVGFQKKLAPGAKSPFWGIVIARVVSLAITLCIPVIFADMMAKQAQREMNSYYNNFNSFFR